MAVRETFLERLRGLTETQGRGRAIQLSEMSEAGLSKILSGKTLDPGLFRTKSIADAYGVSVGYLLGEEGHELSAGDRARLKEIGSWLADRFSEDAKPDLYDVEAREMPRLKVADRPADEEDLPHMEDFIERDFDYPRPWHFWHFEIEDEAGAAAESGFVPLNEEQMKLLNQKEVLETAKRVIRVRGTSMEPQYLDGSLILIDPDRSPSTGEAVALYVEGEGGHLGWWESVTRRQVAISKADGSVKTFPAGSTRVLGVVDRLVDAPAPRKPRAR